ncbi:MAG: hypothetical protein MNPFHGCM_02050 [Gemmatimonadaceae bacterium]|nr:hypothetical protein [Gemmatimonadaceae bacterium]
MSTNPNSQVLHNAPERRGLYVLLGALLIAIGWLTLMPVAPSQPLNPACILCGDLGGADYIQNVILFAPLGLALGLIFPRQAIGLVLPVLLSLAIELVQWRFIPGRSATLGDLLANSMGGGIGWLTGSFSDFLLLPHARRARRLAAASGVVLVGLLGIAGRLLQPSVPLLVFFVQWLPNKVGYDVFAGKVDTLEVNGRFLKHGDAADPVYEPAIVGPERNDVRAVVGATARGSERIALIARMANMSNERFMIGRDDQDFVYRARTHSADAGLRTPIVSLDDAFQLGGGWRSADDTATIEIESSVVQTEWRLKVRGPAGEATRTVALSPATAWAFFMPRDIPLGAHYLWANALFLLVITLPTMYWLAVSATSRTRRRDTMRGRAKTGVMLAVFLAALASAHILWGGAAFHAVEWAGVAAAGVLGLASSRITRQARRRRPLPEDHDFTRYA